MHLKHKPGGVFTLFVQDAHLHQGQLELHHIMYDPWLYSLDDVSTYNHLVMVLLQLVIPILGLRIVRIWINLDVNCIKEESLGLSKKRL